VNPTVADLKRLMANLAIALPGWTKSGSRRLSRRAGLVRQDIEAERVGSGMTYLTWNTYVVWRESWPYFVTGGRVVGRHGVQYDLGVHDVAPSDFVMSALSQQLHPALSEPLSHEIVFEAIRDHGRQGAWNDFQLTLLSAYAGDVTHLPSTMQAIRANAERFRGATSLVLNEEAIELLTELSGQAGSPASMRRILTARAALAK
jgi:hypothetical protein